ncbi:hypothetical protein FH972_006866 [Carpinus fangiana]|uniref:Pentacotripeptide-repeat region of PRORP domain-containing protein n=1 Tax=Carpinus fangiana TaxID=176857 RepID=A0A5N6QVF5_9ROSI|nr:hypothetical protein FH972_006866 [Carpinus fangiana]
MQSSPSLHSIAVCFPMPLNGYTSSTVQINLRRLSQLNHLKAFTCFAQNSFGASFNSISLTEASQSFTSLIQLCTEEKSSIDVGKIQTHMIKSGFYLNIGNKLMDAYVKCGRVKDARQVFDELPNKHIVTWNSMISSYTSLKRSKEAIGLYERMVLEGVLPDEYTFSRVFKAFSDLGIVLEGRRAHGLSVVLGLEVLNVFVGSALVDMYAKFGKLRDARLVMDRFVKKDVVLFTALIVGYNQHGEEGEVLQVFGKMINEGIKANEYTTASILISCGNLKDPRKGKLVHGLAIKSGFESAVASQTSLLTIQMIRISIIPNSFSLSTALQACSKLAKLEEGRQIHGIATKLNLDTDKYVSVALIDMYGKCGNTEMARSVFDALIEFDVVSVNSMIYSYAKNGFACEALELFNTMKDLVLEPNDVTFLNVLLACNNAGLVEEGCRIFASIHGAVDMAERVVNRALELAPEDERTYALLSKHCASSGNWNQFIEVKSAMKEMKLKKISAMNSVDIKKDVHTSKAEYWSHQKCEKISEMLVELIEKVKKYGFYS